MPYPQLTFLHPDDAASAKASLKGEKVSGEEAKKQGEEWAKVAGSKLDNTVSWTIHPSSSSSSSSSLNRVCSQVEDVRSRVHQADKTISTKMGEAETKFDKLKNDGSAQFDKTKKDTGKELNNAIDKFDKTVEKKTADAKSGISSWFGFGK